MGVRFVLRQELRRRWPQLGRGLGRPLPPPPRRARRPEPTDHLSAGHDARGKKPPDTSQGTIKAPIRRFLDPPGLEGLLRKQHPGAAPEELQHLAQQHRALTEQLIAAIQVLVWVMTAVRQEAWDLLLLALALQAEDVQLARAHQPPACSRCRDLRELATGCGAAASSPHFTRNRAARQHEQQQQHQQHQQHQQPPSHTRLQFVPLTEHTMADAIRAVSTSAAKQRHQQRHPEEDPAASSYLLHVYHHHYSPHRSQDVVGPPRDVTGLVNVINDLARQMQQNADQYHSSNMFRWLKTWCRVKLYRAWNAAGGDVDGGGGGAPMDVDQAAGAAGGVHGMGGGAYGFGGDDAAAAPAAAAAAGEGVAMEVDQAAGAAGLMTVRLPPKQREIVAAAAKAILRDQDLQLTEAQLRALDGRPDIVQRMQESVQQQRKDWRHLGLFIGEHADPSTHLTGGCKYLPWAAANAAEVEELHNQLVAAGVQGVGDSFPLHSLCPVPDMQQIHLGFGEWAWMELFNARHHLAAQHHSIPKAALPLGKHPPSLQQLKAAAARKAASTAVSTDAVKGSSSAASCSDGPCTSAAAAAGSSSGTAPASRWGPSGGGGGGNARDVFRRACGSSSKTADVWKYSGLLLGAEAMATQGSHFAGYVRTDGVSMSATYHRRHHPTYEKQNEAAREVRVPLEQLPRTNMPAADPGCSTNYATVAHSFTRLPSWPAAQLGAETVLALPEVRSGACTVAWPADWPPDQRAAAVAQHAMHLTATQAARAGLAASTQVRAAAAARAAAAVHAAPAGGAEQAQARPEQVVAAAAAARLARLQHQAHLANRAAGMAQRAVNNGRPQQPAGRLHARGRLSGV